MAPGADGCLLPSAGDAAGKAEERLVYGIEHNSTLLECVPRTLQAKVIWFVQRAHEARKEEVLAIALALPLISWGFSVQTAWCPRAMCDLRYRGARCREAPVSRHLPEGSCWEIQQLQVFPAGSAPLLFHESPSHFAL